MESKKFPGKIAFIILIINLLAKSLADIIIKSPNQFAELFNGKNLFYKSFRTIRYRQIEINLL